MLILVGWKNLVKIHDDGIWYNISHILSTSYKLGFTLM